MDLIKEYIKQALTTASHNLRLTSEKIEVIAILKEYISEKKDVEQSISEMKKITELSKFAIKLGDINTYINSDKVDFIKLSEKFKEQSHNLIIELSSLLEKVTPDHLRELLERVDKKGEERDKTLENVENSESSFNDNEEFNLDENEFQEDDSNGSARDILRKSIIMEDLPENKENFDFKDFEKSILKPIKEIDNFLNHLHLEDYDQNEIDKYISITSKNAEFASEIGFEIISNMHETVARTLRLVKDQKLNANKSVIENLRACLIVIVAVVRGKDVDITDYLNRAEKFGIDIKEKV